MKIKTPKQRIVWGFSPVSRIVPSKKRYNRKKENGQLKKYRGNVNNR
ncbi:MAG: hypothetical protein L3J43_10410 [Sulfurovum sp.]|nr:hypothetical protein [Sulfurovum sp.]